MATNDLIANMYEEPEVTGLARQRQLAQLLIQGGAQTPQGQMINGMYVPVNPIERLGNLGSLLMGLKSSENLDTKQSELAAALRQKEMGALQNYLKLKRGTPGQEGTPDFVQAGPMPDGSNIPIQYGKKAIAAVPGDADAANLYAASNPYSKVLREMGQKALMQDPEWEKYDKNLGNGMVQTGLINKKSATPMATFIPGGTKVDKDYIDAMYEGKLPGGQAMPMQNDTAPQGGVPLSVRNNNPGNMVGPDGQFRVFNTPQEGDAALLSDINLKLSGQSPAYKARFGNQPVTPATLAETWSPASAKGNSVESTTNYAKFIAQQLGIAPNQPIPNTPEAAQIVKAAITKFEAGAYGNQPQQQFAANAPQPGAYQQPRLSPKRQDELNFKKAEEVQKIAQNIPRLEETAQSAINQVRGLTSHAGFSDLVGATWLPGMRFVSGSDAANADARLEQIKGGAFLKAYGDLRGGGQISNTEGDKAQAAATRMSRAQSEKEFLEAAQEYEDSIKRMVNIDRQSVGLPPKYDVPPQGEKTVNVTPKDTSKVSLMAPIYATNGQERIVSTDGGKTWNPVGAK